MLLFYSLAISLSTWLPWRCLGGECASGNWKLTLTLPWKLARVYSWLENEFFFWHGISFRGAILVSGRAFQTQLLHSEVLCVSTCYISPPINTTIKISCKCSSPPATRFLWFHRLWPFPPAVIVENDLGRPNTTAPCHGRSLPLGRGAKSYFPRHFPQGGPLLVTSYKWSW